MIHYTILPEDLIFYDPQQTYTQREMIHIDGVPMLIERKEGEQATIVQLLSPDPQHFLDPRFRPGTVLQLVPKSM